MKFGRIYVQSILSTMVFMTILYSPSIIDAQNITYPKTRTTNDVDFYFGAKVFDPYRWLENLDSPEVQAWADTQMQFTRAYLDSIPFRTIIYNRLRELMDSSIPSCPAKHGDRYFLYKREEGNKQYALYIQDSLQDIAKIVIDPNTLSSAGTTAISGISVSNDGKILAYSLSYGGSDWQEIHIRDIDKEQELADTLKWCKFSDIVWSPDARGIFYTRFPKPGSLPESELYFKQSICWHRLGTSQDEDSLVFKNNKSKAAIPSIYSSSDRKYILMFYWWPDDGKLDIDCHEFSSGKTINIMKKEKGYYEFIGNVGSMFYFKTQKKAPGGRILAIDINKSSKNNWREILPTAYNVIDFAGIFDSVIVVAYMEEAFDKLKLLDLDGKLIKQIELPTMGSISAISGRVDDSLMFISFSSYIYPTTILTYDFATGIITPLEEAELEYDFTPYVTRQITFESSYKAIVPMFLTYRSDLVLNGDTPTILYGYGGFGISETPYFSPSILLWLENGGIYAVANIRGGGEFGFNWYWGGQGYYKQNCFDDFANAAHWLIDNKLTSSEKLAIWGGSNGGLLTAVSMEQHPDLSGAVVSQVPVTDMLRYPKFTVGKAWLNEYGNPSEDAGCFSTLRAYSPLHNVSHWTKYPPLLVTTGENDDRVPPLHAYKFIAAIQAEDDGNNPKLLRIEKDAGHGQGKPFDKIIDEKADIYTFLFKSLNMNPPVGSSYPDTLLISPTNSPDTKK